MIARVHLCIRLIIYLGQWAPIVGTGLAILGSLYLLLAQAMEEERNPEANPGAALDSGLMRKVAKIFIRLSDYFLPARERFDDTEFRRGSAVDYPEIPGEQHRNRELSRIRTQFNSPRDSDDSITSAVRSLHSRSSSFGSRMGVERPSVSAEPTSPIRRDTSNTLEVPAPTHRSSLPRNPVSEPEMRRIHTRTDSQNTPAIVLSSNPDSPYPSHVVLT